MNSKNKEIKLEKIALSDDIEIKEVDKVESSLFLQKYSIGDGTEYSINIGCYYKGELSVIMSFKGMPEDKTYAMGNYTTDNRYRYEYIGNEMIKYFPNEIIAYADRNWINDKDTNYLVLMGFSFNSVIEPYYKLYDGKYKVWNCGYFKYEWR